MAEKQFYFHDKSGRVWSGKMDYSQIILLENDISWDGDYLHEWAEEADKDDKWEDHKQEITCIEEGTVKHLKFTFQDLIKIADVSSKG